MTGAIQDRADDRAGWAIERRLLTRCSWIGFSCNVIQCGSEFPHILLEHAVRLRAIADALIS